MSPHFSCIQIVISDTMIYLKLIPLYTTTMKQKYPLINLQIWLFVTVNSHHFMTLY